MAIEPERIERRSVKPVALTSKPRRQQVVVEPAARNRHRFDVQEVRRPVKVKLKPFDDFDARDDAVTVADDFHHEEVAPAPVNPVMAQVAEVTDNPGLLSLLQPRRITGGLPISPLMILAGIGLLSEADKAVFALLGPDIRDYFGVSIGFVLTMTALTGIVSLLAALPIGYLIDRVNRVRMSSIGLAVLGLSLALTGLAPTIVLLGIFRFIGGLGTSLEASNSALLADFYPPQTRPSVYASQELAKRVGKVVVPLAAGVLASTFFWQLPVLLEIIPTALLFVLMLTYLREPVRGVWERRAMGAEEEVANTAQRPPSLSEGMRIAWNVRTMRRILFALPFLVGSSLGILQLLGFYFQDVYNLGPAARGTLASLHEGAAIPGVLLGGAVATRLLRDRPSRVITYGGIMAVFTGIAYGVLAFSPSLPLAVAFMIIGGFASAILAPATTALITLVVPARARGIGLSLLVIFVIPGVVPLFFIGQYADDHGVQQSMLLLTPLFILGALILTSAGSSVDADIRSATAAAMAAEESRQSKAAGAAKLLVVRDLDVGYDDVQILFNVDFDVEEGEIIALLGTNGAGKSTLLRAISGLAVPWNGAVFYDGEDITYLPANEHAGRGIIQTPGGRGVFPGLTVAENLRVAAWMFRDDDAYVAEATETVLTYFPRLRERLDQPAGNLSGGEQQMLTLSQAFLSRPRLLMIDELSLGLAPAIVEQLLGIVRAIAERGTTIVLVEQSVNVALTIAEKAVFMEKGEIKFHGSTADLLQRPDILRSVYLRGSSTATGLVLSGKKSSVLEDANVDTALELRGVRKHWGGVHAINGVSFAVPEGQTLGLIGPNGAGKTTIFDVISGFVVPDDGEVLLYGDPLSELTPDDRARLGLHRSFQDARLFPSLTVAENIAVALERHVEARSTTMAALHLPSVKRSEVKLARRVDRLVDLLNLGDFRDKFVRELSTGSRRLVDLACVMAADPRVLLLDEPSAGIAQKEAEELGPLLQRIKYETGATMLIIEHDMPLIMSVSDELLALEVGTVITRGLPQDVVADEQVIASYLGTSEEAINRSGSN